MGKPKTDAITEPQARTLWAICKMIGASGLPPTIQELADSLGISHASAHEQVAQLVRKGYLRKEPRKARSLVVLKQPDR